MPAKQVEALKSGPPPQIEIVVGQAHLGMYAVFLWNDKAKRVKEGANDDAIADKFPLCKKTSELDGHLLTWQITIQSLTGIPGEAYSATVTITQGTKVLHTESHPEVPGETLDGAKLIVKGVRFAVV